jgi:hypothetical protein
MTSSLEIGGELKVASLLTFLLQRECSAHVLQSYHFKKISSLKSIEFVKNLTSCGGKAKFLSNAFKGTK